MKILIFSVAYLPFVGGAEIAVKEITDRIKNIEFHMITVNLDGKQRKEEKVGNVYVYRVCSGNFGKFLFPFIGVWKAVSLHRVHHFSATWSIMANYAGFAALFFKYLKPKLPFILTLQEGDPIGYIKKQIWFVYPLFTQIFRKANRIQSISHYLEDFAKSMGAKAPIMVIPNGVNVSLFSQEYPAQVLENLKMRLGKRPGDIFLVTASRLVTKNGIGDVVNALPFLSTNIKFLIIGLGPLAYEIKNLADKLGVLDRVIFTGFIDHNELPKYLKISDIFIRPSLSEGMGNSFIEAMASGIPVIATQVGGIPDFLLEGETGLYCGVQNPQSVAEQVMRLVDTPELAKVVIKNAKKLVIERYEWDLVANNMEKMVFIT